MLKLERIFKNYDETGAFNEQVNLHGFIDSNVFLAKSGELAVILEVRGVDYECLDGDMGRVDLELATEHYRPRQLAENARAGFSFYASRTEADRLRRVLDKRELTAEILTL